MSKNWPESLSIAVGSRVKFPSWKGEREATVTDLQLVRKSYGSMRNKFNVWEAAIRVDKPDFFDDNCKPPLADHPNGAHLIVDVECLTPM